MSRGDGSVKRGTGPAWRQLREHLPKLLRGTQPTQPQVRVAPAPVERGVALAQLPEAPAAWRRRRHREQQHGFERAGTRDGRDTARQPTSHARRMPFGTFYLTDRRCCVFRRAPRSRLLTAPSEVRGFQLLKRVLMLWRCVPRTSRALVVRAMPRCRGPPRCRERRDGTRAEIHLRCGLRLRAASHRACKVRGAVAGAARAPL